jgi:hypothetical protein
MHVDSRSAAKASVIALSAVFDEESMPNILRCGFAGSEFHVSEPLVLDTLTIRPAGASRRSGSIACVTATNAEHVGLEHRAHLVERHSGQEA